MIHACCHWLQNFICFVSPEAQECRMVASNFTCAVLSLSFSFLQNKEDNIYVHMYKTSKRKEKHSKVQLIKWSLPSTYTTRNNIKPSILLLLKKALASSFILCCSFFWSFIFPRRTQSSIFACSKEEKEPKKCCGSSVSLTLFLQHSLVAFFYKGSEWP